MKIINIQTFYWQQMINIQFKYISNNRDNQRRPVGPRPIASRTGRQVSGVVGPAVRQLDWGMELVEGDHGRGQHQKYRLSNHVFIVEYRLLNPMMINLLFASQSFRPSWYWHHHLPDYYMYYYSTVRCRYRHLTPRHDTNIALDNGAMTLVYETITSLKHVVIE